MILIWHKCNAACTNTGNRSTRFALFKLHKVRETLFFKRYLKGEINNKYHRAHIINNIYRGKCFSQLKHYVEKYSSIWYLYGLTHFPTVSKPFLTNYKALNLDLKLIKTFTFLATTNKSPLLPKYSLLSHHLITFLQVFH